MNKISIKNNRLLEGNTFLSELVIKIMIFSKNKLLLLKVMK